MPFFKLFSGTSLAGVYGSVTTTQSVKRDMSQLYGLELTETDVRSEGLASGNDILPQIYVIMLISGRLEVGQWRHARSLLKGDIVALNSWTPFSLRVPGAAEMLVIRFPSWWAIAEVLGDSVFSSWQEISRHFVGTAAIQMLARCMMDVETPEEQHVASVQMLSHMLRAGFEFCAAPSDTKSKPVDRMSRLFGTMSKQLDTEHYSPKDAAAALKCSVRTIHQTCADHGTTFNQMLMEMRLSWAAHRLTNSGERITQIAFSTGFSSLSHFCRLFKTHFGVSASAYRAGKRR